MTINSELRAEILRLYHAEKWRLNTIARQLRVHHSTVRRVIEQEGQVLPVRKKRARKVDPYLPFIEETLRQYPGLRASRLHAMIAERGYTGKAPQFRAIIAKLRGSRQAEPFPHPRASGFGIGRLTARPAGSISLRMRYATPRGRCVVARRFRGLRAAEAMKP